MTLFSPLVAKILVVATVAVAVFVLLPNGGLFALAVIAFFIVLELGRRGSEASSGYAREAADWQAQMEALQPTIDLDDDGHLFEWLDPPQWEAVFAELAKMPAGERSMRAAIGTVSPDSL